MSERDPQTTEFRALVKQLNELADRLQKMAPEYTPPPFTPEEMLRMLRENIDRLPPQMRLTVLQELQKDLPRAQVKDLLNVNTWRGMWFVARQRAQEENRSLYERLSGRLSRLPGADRFSNLPGVGTVGELGTMLEGSEPRDFLDLDTWKGLWFVLNYSVQNEVEELRHRVLGTPPDDEEIDIVEE